MKIDPITLTYFVTIAWGLSNGFLAKFKSRLKDKNKYAADNTVDYFIDEKIKDKQSLTVIADYDLAVEKFTPEYLFCCNSSTLCYHDLLYFIESCVTGFRLMRRVRK